MPGGKQSGGGRFLGKSAKEKSVYREKPLEVFLHDLAARKPTPGGGATAALTGALAASQAAMCAEYTTGREKFKAVKTEMKEAAARLRALGETFLDLCDEDVRAYENFTAAAKLPKEDEPQRAERCRRLTETLEAAVGVPENILASCKEAFEFVERLSEVGNPLLISDIGVAAALLEAAAQSAALQIEVNLAGQKGAEWTARRQRAPQLLSACFQCSQRTGENVRQIMADGKK